MLAPRRALPCVGLVVLGGCLTFVIAPDEFDFSSEDARPREPWQFPTVIIDPGHGGRDEGTKWRGVSEQDLTLDLAERLEKMLKIAGFRTVMTRRANLYVPLEERSREANSYHDAVLISLHFNSENSANSSGIETYYARAKLGPANDWTWIGLFSPPEPLPPDSSETLAASIQTSLIMRTEAKNRGIRPANFYVVRHARCPAVLVEGGFISNAFEAQMLNNPAYRDLLAQGITEGLLRYQKSRMEGAKPPVVALERP